MDSTLISRQGRRTRRLVLAGVTLLTAAAACRADGLADALARAAGDFETRYKAKVALAVVDLRTGKPLAARRADEPMCPASNQKLLTGAFALEKLGADFQFQTGLYRVRGQMWLVGSGDPTLGDPVLAGESGKTIYDELDALAKAAGAAAKRGETFDGNLVVFGCFTPAQQQPLESLRHPDWPDDQADTWYCAPISALSYHNNCYDVTFVRSGGRVVPHVSPASSWIRVVNQTRAGSRQLWSLRSDECESEVVVRGTVKQPSSDPISVACNRPAVLLARVLADRLERSGPGRPKQVMFCPLIPEADRKLPEPLAVARTPLATALRRMDKTSLNMVAECVMLRAGDGTWGGSSAAMKRTLIERLGCDGNVLDVRDGSGMSARNRVSAGCLAGLLARMAGRRDFPLLLNSLPANGVDGTLTKRMADTRVRGRLRAKTGSLRGVSALSGYVLNSEGAAVLCFSILVNDIPDGQNWRAKQLQDALCGKLLEAVDQR